MPTVAESLGYNHGERALRKRPVSLGEIRLGRGLSLRELQERAGINRATLSQIERGRLVATPAEADAIALALGLPVGSLVTRTMLVYEAAA